MASLTFNAGKGSGFEPPGLEVPGRNGAMGAFTSMANSDFSAEEGRPPLGVVRNKLHGKLTISHLWAVRGRSTGIDDSLVFLRISICTDWPPPLDRRLGVTWNSVTGGSSNSFQASKPNPTCHGLGRYPVESRELL